MGVRIKCSKNKLEELNIAGLFEKIFFQNKKSILQ